ncbi:hemerythrin domain-containing protein [Nocardioides sp. GY 10113]|uniref:hemerythrin domain-containing protein n=1 Tax=Nocardioides sp. GY 10113 TaxID=2569761 RepID=UPI0010A89C0C|nr:hemerythrin domain-containing protein [Nocardioides sp. GY 10113]TIC88883.1 hemerythrin domain-containing protein [Nocardioides sp. GY 10113]
MTATTPTAERPDIREMVVVHRAFRREFGASPAYVREVAPGDTARAALVADHLRLVMGGLEMHHTGEDVVLWPLLLERAAPSTGLVETMQAQHHAVDGYADQVGPLLAAWERGPTVEAGEELAALIERFTAALVEHLDLEEREILPLCLHHVTAAEWASMGDHGVEKMTKRQLPLLFGAVLEECDAAERRLMVSHLPAPVRLFLRTIGAWQYRRYVTALRGR